MTTFTQMVDDVLAELRGYVRDQQQSTHITTDVSDTATSWTVNDASVLSKGRAEIGDEIVWIDSVDRTTNTVTIAPYGRGMDGTTAVAHSTNDRLVGNPSFPRAVVKTALNDVLKSVPLYGVSTTTVTYTAAKVTYELPAAADHVISVSWDVVGPSGVWAPVRHWRMDKNADTTTYTSGKTLDIYDPIVPGSTVSVVYATDPVVLSADSDVFTTTTGLRSSCEDVIRYGALAKLTMSLDTHVLQNRSVEANTLVGRVQAGQGSSVSKFYYAMFQQRMNEERASLQADYPINVHYTR